MSLRLAERSGTARVAVVGATTDRGECVREALAGRRIPGSRVDLYGSHGGEAVISEYAGEARLILQSDLDQIAGHELIFLCERSELAQAVVAAMGPGALAIDMVGAVEGPPRPPRLHADVNPGDAEANAKVLATPHPLAMLLGELIHPLSRRFGIVEALALVLRPASDFGQSGVDELRDQTVRLLSFTEVPTERFGRQLAFNLIPQDCLTEDGRGIESEVAADVGDLLGWEASRLGLRLLTVPVFHGHSVQLRLRLATAAATHEIEQELQLAGMYDDGATDPPRTPLQVMSEPRVVVSEVVEDGLGGFWLWGVAGELMARLAEQAIRVAGSRCDL